MDYRTSRHRAVDELPASQVVRGLMYAVPAAAMMWAVLVVTALAVA
jgi:hypothetical protein